MYEGMRRRIGWLSDGDGDGDGEGEGGWIREGGRKQVSKSGAGSISTAVCQCNKLYGVELLVVVVFLKTGTNWRHQASRCGSGVELDTGPPSNGLAQVAVRTSFQWVV
jgi:hypothetical protein